jgi:hypothetical protein
VVWSAVRWYCATPWPTVTTKSCWPNGYRGESRDRVSVGAVFTPLLIDAARPCRHAPGDQWFVDETYVKVKSRWAMGTSVPGNHPVRSGHRRPPCGETGFSGYSPVLHPRAPPHPAPDRGEPRPGSRVSASLMSCCLGLPHHEA